MNQETFQEIINNSNEASVNLVKEVTERCNSVISKLKKEIINAVKEEAKTYKDIQMNISHLRKNAIWENNRVLLAVIDEVLKQFENKKNGLSIK